MRCVIRPELRSVCRPLTLKPKFLIILPYYANSVISIIRGKNCSYSLLYQNKQEKGSVPTSSQEKHHVSPNRTRPALGTLSRASQDTVITAEPGNSDAHSLISLRPLPAYPVVMKSPLLMVSGSKQMFMKSSLLWGG